jgi:hypothetical protein
MNEVLYYAFDDEIDCINQECLQKLDDSIDDFMNKCQHENNYLNDLDCIIVDCRLKGLQ